MLVQHLLHLCITSAQFYKLRYLFPLSLPCTLSQLLDTCDLDGAVFTNASTKSPQIHLSSTDELMAVTLSPSSYGHLIKVVTGMLSAPAPVSDTCSRVQVRPSCMCSYLTAAGILPEWTQTHPPLQQPKACLGPPSVRRTLELQLQMYQPISSYSRYHCACVDLWYPQDQVINPVCGS